MVVVVEMEMDNIKNGILNQKIYAQILSNLEKVDLLNSRLVSRAWNKECMSIFKKPSSKFRQILDSKKVADEFINFVSSFNPPRSLLPIHLKFQSIEGDDEFADEDDVEVIEKAKTKYHDFRITVQKLIKLLGPESIRDLTFTYAPPYEEGFLQGLCQILIDLSPGLQKLDLTIDCQFTEDVNTENFVLPNVRHLKSSTCSRGPEIRGRNTVWKLIRACPNLEKLNVWLIFGEDAKHWTDPFPPPQVKSLSLGQFNFEWLLEKFHAQSNGLNLQKFKIQSVRGFNMMGMGREPNVPTCLDILAVISPSLVHLSLPLNSTRGGCWCCGPWSDHPTKVPFPCIMPKLKHLDIWSPGKHNAIIIDPELFPALESMSLPYVDTILNWGSNMEFPKVKSLSIGCASNKKRLPVPVNDPDPELELEELSISECLEHFLKVFPSLKKISILKPNWSDADDCVVIKHVLRGLLRAHGAEKIQVVELKNCNQNYLGQVVEQIQNPARFVLENMRMNPLLDQHLLMAFEKLTGGTELRMKDHVLGRQGQPDLRLTIVQEVEPTSEVYLKNVRKVKIELPMETRVELLPVLKDGGMEVQNEGRSPESLESLRARKPMHLPAMLKNFPDLEEIQVSSLVFAPNAELRAKRIKGIYEKFPGVKISII